MNVNFGGSGFDDGAGIIVGVAFALSAAGTVYLGWCSGKITTDATLWWAHATAGALLVVASVVMVSTANETELSGRVALTFSVWKELGASADPAFEIVREEETVGPGFNLALLPPVFTLVSGVQHVYSAWSFRTAGDGKYMLFEEYAGGWFPRVIDYALSTPLIFICNAYFFDATLSIFTIFLIFSSYGLLMFMGWFSETAWYNGAPKTVVFAPFIAGSAFFILSWIPLFMQLEAGSRRSIELGGDDAGPPVFVYLFILWVIGSFLVFPYLTLQKIRSAVVGKRPCYGGSVTVFNNPVYTRVPTANGAKGWE